MLKNSINNQWLQSSSTESTPIINSATGEVIAQTPLSSSDEVGQAVNAAVQAFPTWRKVPIIERVQYLFKIKAKLEENLDNLAELITQEHGKILSEAKGEVRRSIQMLDTACGMPALMMGTTSEDVASGIDCMSMRQPMGVFAAITPFNFPLMVPSWFWPFAIACGNTFVLKPSERVSLSAVRLFEILEQAKLPPGVMNLVLGGQSTANALLTNPHIAGISFVGSTPVAKHIYEQGCAHKKRVQALGGAKNFMVVLPDAVNDETALTCVESVIGCAGQRCLAGSVIIGVGDAYEKLIPLIKNAAAQIHVGNGLNPESTMGPLISAQAVERIKDLIQSGINQGATLILDGRQKNFERGFFLAPSVFTDVKPSMRIAQEEIFGPIIALGKSRSLEEAIAWINSSSYGNTASLFTDSGAAARKFSYEAHPAMLGLNIGVPAPMAFFPFGGSKDSFFGDIKAHGTQCVNFYTDSKVVIQRWNQRSSIW
jgi:malonate-semialdehyde dehydrogenase (acetylating)/methylmalonate-semialdehyde dehydrogenase